MAEITKKFIIRNRNDAGAWETLYPQTVAAQVITDNTAKFVTQAQIDSWNAKAGSADTTTAINTSKAYTDTKIAALVDSAPEALDTLAELASALTAHATEYDALLTVVGLKATTADLTAHINNKANPHAVTKAQVGLSNVDNTTDAAKPVSTATQTALNTKANASDLTAHIGDKTNPHGVTKAQVGLSNVDNTTDLAKPISTATQTALNGKASTAVVTSSADGLMIKTDKVKLDGIDTGANNYVHPANHPATIITQDASNRFVTDTEKATWNAKAPTTLATAAVDGLMPKADKSKLDAIAAGANNYVHPANHPASIITQDATNRFVTDAEKTAWNAKATTTYVDNAVKAIPSVTVSATAPATPAIGDFWYEVIA